MNNLPAKGFEDTITLPSQACGCEQLTGEKLWGHDYVTIASFAVYSSIYFITCPKDSTIGEASSLFEVSAKLDAEGCGGSAVVTVFTVVSLSEKNQKTKKDKGLLRN